MAGMDPGKKYAPFPPAGLKDRNWPDCIIAAAPIWCSVDLRDGNQALVEPMGPERKKRMFEALVAMGFKEIEVGFPSASQTDFDFARWLVDEGNIPDDVTIQVLTQAREDLVLRTYEAIEGVRRAIVHVYNSTSTTQRRVVFRADKAGVKKIATDGARWVREGAERARARGADIRFEYSPESFTQTELPYAMEVCEAVLDEWRATPDHRVIINLPATVEVAGPNVFADQIEWMGRQFSDRTRVILSVHPHNDRGSGVAAAELAQLAGADRIEGTLFGNGERTGNVDLVTLGLNLYTQGVNPGIDFSNLPQIRRTVEYCNRLPVHERHPYGGDLVFTAFSGSHQDAIKKGFAAMKQSNSGRWDVPYLPIDPQDIGATYEAVIRVNSQSGKGGVSYLLETDYGLRLPRRLQVEFSAVVQEHTDASEKEMTSAGLMELLRATYLEGIGPYRFARHHSLPTTGNDGARDVELQVLRDDEPVTFRCVASGPIDACCRALCEDAGGQWELVDYSEHSAGIGSDARAWAYVELTDKNGLRRFGVGTDKNIVVASLRAVVSAINRMMAAS